MKDRIVREEVPHQAIDQHGSRQALLHEEQVVPERRVQLAQTLRHPGLARLPLGFPFEHLRRDTRLPVLLEGDRLLQIGPDLSLEDLPSTASSKDLVARIWCE